MKLTSYRISKSWRTQARVPKGQPTGGEWTGNNRGYGGVVPLSGVAPLTTEQRFADAGVKPGIAPAAAPAPEAAAPAPAPVGHTNAQVAAMSPAELAAHGYTGQDHHSAIIEGAIGDPHGKFVREPKVAPTKTHTNVQIVNMTVNEQLANGITSEQWKHAFLHHVYGDSNAPFDMAKPAPGPKHLAEGMKPAAEAEASTAAALHGRPEDFKVVSQDAKTNITVLESTGPSIDRLMPDYSGRNFKDLGDNVDAHSAFHNHDFGYSSIAGTSRQAFEDRWLKSKLSDDEVHAISQYTGPQYIPINKVQKYLRTGNTGYGLSNEEAEKYTKHLDSALAKSHIPEDVTVFRGLSSPAWEHIEPHVGEGKSVILDHGFVSTSTSLQTAMSFSEGTQVHIRVPKGAQGLSVAKIGSHTHEKEVLLPRGTKIVIRKVERTQLSYGSERVVLHADLIP